MCLSLPTLSLSHLQSQDPQVSALVSSAISHAYGPNAPGVLLVSGLSPDFLSQRASLLSCARTLANLPPQELKNLQFGAQYFNGWSRASESFQGKMDTSKGSFYANPMYDHPAGGNSDLVEKYPIYMKPNVWPTHPSCNQLEPSFKKVGRYVNEIALLLARHCDAYIAETLRPDATFASLHASLSESTSAKGRLLNYYPPSPKETHSAQEDNLWCGYHNDHCTLTGLLSGQFYTTPDMTILPTSPDPTSGLYVSRDNNPPEQIAIPQDCIAFQIGECAQIASGGVLRATPHAVVMPRGHYNLARVTLAVFLQPNPWEVLNMPSGMSDTDKQAALDTNSKVPALRERYVEGETFEQFAGRTGHAYSSMEAAARDNEMGAQS